MSANLPVGLSRGHTDFGRETNAETDVSLAAALREHAVRMARAEAMRYQITMGLLGFIGGLLVVVPLVLWVAPQNGSISRDATAEGPPAWSNQIAAAEATAGPSLISVPTIAIRDDAQDLKAPTPADDASAEPVELARNLIRSGDILAARRVLGQPELSQYGPALFMLAETYDPNVLAALGATGVHAETSTARRYYEAALSEGVVSAAPRLEALE